MGLGEIIIDSRTATRFAIVFHTFRVNLCYRYLMAEVEGWDTISKEYAIAI